MADRSTSEVNILASTCILSDLVDVFSKNETVLEIERNGLINL